MKLLGCFGLICALMLIASFAFLIWLQSARPSELTPDPYAPPPAPGTEQEEQGHTFSSTSTPEQYRLRYGFFDHDGKRHEITCGISRSDHDREVASFGYRSKEIDAAIDSQLQKWLDSELSKRNIAQYYKIRVYGRGAYKSEYYYPGTLSDGEFSRIMSQVVDMNEMLKKEFDTKLNQTEEPIYRKYGFKIRKNTIEIDYGALVIRGQQPLTDCFESILRSGNGANVKQVVGLYLAFFQQIPYQLPPDTENGKETLGFWVPTEVLVHDHGDCDSKSVALSAMLRSFGLPIIVIQIPHHVLIAVEMRPGPQQEFVQIRNRYFVLCEAAGPAGPPGHEGGSSIQGHFEYTLIEPDMRGVTADAQPATR